MNLDFFPPLNATLNALAGIFLIVGFLQIKKGNRKGHAFCMVSALIVSAVFLVCYVTFKTLKGNVHTSFPVEYPVMRKIYYVMLISHIILAIGMLPLIFIAVRFAVKKQFDRHRKMVKWAYPIWMYVSITGVLVYFFLYQWFLPTESASGEVSPAPATATEVEPSAAIAGLLKSDGLVIEPEVFEYQAEAGEAEFTADFVLKNTGSTPVKLTKLDSSCTCLLVEADDMDLAPGEQTELKAVFDISKLSGEAEKSVYIDTDVPGSHGIRLGVRVSIPAIVEIDPITTKWAVGDEPSPREIAFRVLRDKPIRVTEIKSSRESVSAELKTVEEGREYRIVLTPESTDSIMLGFVKIVTDCELEQLQRHMAYYVIQNSPVQIN